MSLKAVAAVVAVAEGVTVNVSANTQPQIGSYPNASVATGDSTTVAPDAPPSDDLAFSVGVTSATFTGTLSVHQSTGVVSISSANSGVHTIRVLVTDACFNVAERTFTLTVNAPDLGGPVKIHADTAARLKTQGADIQKQASGTMPIL